MKLASRRSRKTKTLANYLESLSQDNQIHRMRNGYTGVASSSITADALSDEVTILDKAIQSSTYVSGADGWRIDGSGDAEFSNVYVRGDINADTGTIGYWNISNPVVTRHFGTKTLKGTFLESYDHGFDDSNTISGSYVGLYKSYNDTEVSFNAFSVISDLVTVYTQNQSYGEGDYVVVTFANTTYQSNFGTGTLDTPVPAYVVTSRNDSFTYLNPRMSSRTSLLTIKSLNRDIKTYPSPFNFQLKTPRIYKNVSKSFSVFINLGANSFSVV